MRLRVFLTLSGWLAVTPFLLSLVLVGGCGGGEGIILPGEGRPAVIAVVDGDEQTGRVGEPLTDSLVVQVTDSRGRPVEGATVAFEFSSAGAGAAVVPQEKTTNGDGLAAARLVLGTSIGRQTGQARVVLEDGRGPIQASFSAIALPENANSMAAVAGRDQSGHVGQPLDDRLVVEVTDGFGNPVAGVPISWSAEGGGTVSESVVPTDEEGRSQVERTLGPTVGQQTTVARSEGLAGSPVTFVHTALAGDASLLTIVSGNDQTAEAGTVLPEDLVVRLVDSQGNGVPGTAVTWVVATGGGSVAPENTITDGDGRTSARWTLGEAFGGQRLDAVVSGVGVASFHATATAIGTTTTITGDSPDPSAPGSTFPVQVRVTSEGPTPTGTVTVTVSGGTPTCSATLSGGAGSCSLTLNIVGDRTLTATYSGAPGLLGSSDTEPHKVEATGPPPPAGTVTAIIGDNPDPTVSGSTFTVSFQVTSSGGTPSGSVTVTVSGGTPTCTGNLSGGSGSCQLTLNIVGDRTLTAAYSGAPGFSSSVDTEPHTVTPAPPSNEPPDADFNWHCEGFNCAFTDNSEDDDGSIVSRSWTFGDGGTSSAEDPTHRYSAPGRYIVTLTVIDDDGASDVSSDEVNVDAEELELREQPSSSAIVGEEFDRQPEVELRAGGDDIARPGVVITASIESGGGTLGGTTTATTDEEGRAQFNNLSISGATGPHTLRFSADGFAPVISNTIDVRKASTATTISDPSDPSVSGSTFTVGFSVGPTQGGGTPTGTVTVSVSGGEPPCTGTLSGGSGSCSLTLTTVGDRTLTATYSGDGVFNESSDQEPHTVEAAPPPPPASTTTTITAVDGVTTPPTVSVDGVPITVSFAVTSGSGAPEGDVQISDGASGGCTGTVAAGSCSFPPSGAGPRTIVAAYQGSLSFEPSSSVGWDHTVDPSSP